MKARTWSRGDLCDDMGELAIVLTDENRQGLIELEMFATGNRARAPSAVLRRPTKVQLEREQRRLLALAKRSKSYAAHINIELQLRAARRSR